ncbi:uncharacterized protein [Argopecten irradians]|uniref:uncharacterized protein n=1 Tax=Argopecten irradians TaxID=31199 RepID=UPI00372122FF
MKESLFHLQTYRLRDISDAILDDPRPLKYRNNPGYTSYVHNAAINYCSQSSMDMAMRYLIPVADLQTAAKDHDYLELPFTQHMVDRAQKVTERQAQDIQNDTKLQAKSQAWIHNRKWRVTASKFGDVTHATSRRNMEKLCSSILSSKPIIKKSVFHGKAYERKAITKFEQKTGLKVKKCGLFVDKDYPYLGATPDGIITEEDKKAIVEVKCPYSGRNESIKPGPHFNFLKYDENGQIVLNVHSKYYDQIQGQMLLSKHQLCYFVVYTSGI